MIEQKEVDLREKTTFRVGGIAKKFYIPEKEEELISLIENLREKNEEYYILSGGSNLLVNDDKYFENVIYMEKVSTSIKMMEEGLFYVGASNRIQYVIREVNKLGYGGFEELFCLPALFGGIIYMNAGIGSKNSVKFNISDFIVKVRAFDVEKKKIITLAKQDCQFEYRSSVFKNGGYVILGAEIKLTKQSKEISDEKIKKRIDYCKKNQEWGKGCFGSCFSDFSPKILKILTLFYKNRRGVRISKNNLNWLVNDGTGNYKDAISIIKNVIFWHKLLRKNIKCEVVIWK